jgi:hypothetical protein
MPVATAQSVLRVALVLALLGDRQEQGSGQHAAPLLSMPLLCITTSDTSGVFGIFFPSAQ